MSQAPKSLGPPFPLSLVMLGDPVRERLLRIDSKRVMKLAERLTGLHDYGDGDFRKRLDDTITTLLRTDWNTLGRFGIRYILHWHLSNRLRIVELLKQRPQIKDIEVERPLVITGLFRTGTTFLHNVLAADPNSRVARMWELAHPVGRKRDLLGDVQWRRWRAGHEVGMDEVMIPEQAEVHAVVGVACAGDIAEREDQRGRHDPRDAGQHREQRRACEQAVESAPAARHHPGDEGRTSAPVDRDPRAGASGSGLQRTQG